jgi:CO dehydrogenase/acetyl-CoA synthase beta subunit
VPYHLINAEAIQGDEMEIDGFTWVVEYNHSHKLSERDGGWDRLIGLRRPKGKKIYVMSANNNGRHTGLVQWGSI